MAATQEQIEIEHRIEVKMFVGVLQRPEDSYEWERLCELRQQEEQASKGDR